MSGKVNGELGILIVKTLNKNYKFLILNQKKAFQN